MISISDPKSAIGDPCNSPFQKLTPTVVAYTMVSRQRRNGLWSMPKPTSGSMGMPPTEPIPILCFCANPFGCCSGTAVCTLSVGKLFHGVPIPPLHVQTQLLPKSRVVIVAIYSSGSKWFANQPTRAQVDKLQRIMGGQEAKWWVSDM